MLSAPRSGGSVTSARPRQRASVFNTPGCKPSSNAPVPSATPSANCGTSAFAVRDKAAQHRCDLQPHGERVACLVVIVQPQDDGREPRHPSDLSCHLSLEEVNHIRRGNADALGPDRVPQNVIGDAPPVAVELDAGDDAIAIVEGVHGLRAGASGPALLLCPGQRPSRRTPPRLGRARAPSPPVTRRGPAPRPRRRDQSMPCVER